MRNTPGTLAVYQNTTEAEVLFFLSYNGGDPRKQCGNWELNGSVAVVVAENNPHIGENNEARAEGARYLAQKIEEGCPNLSPAFRQALVELKSLTASDVRPRDIPVKIPVNGSVPAELQDFLERRATIRYVRNRDIAPTPTPQPTT